MFGVFTFTLTHFLAKTIFSRGYGGVQNSSGNSGGVGWGGGGYFTGPKEKKMEIPGRGGGGLSEIPSMVGVWIFSGTTHSWLSLHSFSFGQTDMKCVGGALSSWLVRLSLD